MPFTKLDKPAHISPEGIAKVFVLTKVLILKEFKMTRTIGNIQRRDNKAKKTERTVLLTFSPVRLAAITAVPPFRG